MGSRDARSVGGDEFTQNSRHALSGHRWAPGPTPCTNVSPTSGLSVDLSRNGEFGLAVDQVLNPHSEVTALHADRVKLVDACLSVR